MLICMVQLFLRGSSESDSIIGRDKKTEREIRIPE